MTSAERPYTLIAELTYRCPLQCVYCSNPVDFVHHDGTIDTERWLSVFREAEDLGVLQCNLTGGEPLLRDDLETLVAGARSAGLYTNLITSGVPLARSRLVALAEAGLNAVQVSVQAASPEPAARIAGRSYWNEKLEVMGWVKELGLPLTINVVIHRDNIGQIDDIVALAERFRADRLELANTQYLGWALLNRQALLPSREQIDLARAASKAARERLKGRMEILFVLPDYHTDTPRACMEGWGRRYIIVSPDGRVLPCHLAHTIPGLQFQNVRDESLASIWTNAPGLQAFRGEGWMPEPCRGCEKRSLDFGGCRCQAFHLTGDASVTDPACSLSKDHALVTEARALAEGPLVPVELLYRSAANARQRAR